MALVGCGRQALYGGRSEETIHPRIPGSQFTILAVIAGNDSRPDLNMSAGVRGILSDSGWTALRAPGRWETESAATMDLCSRPPFNGVVVVVWDRITLRSCPDRAVAYEIQGAELGLRNMAQRLIVYLRSGARDTTAVRRGA